MQVILLGSILPDRVPYVAICCALCFGSHAESYQRPVYMCVHMYYCSMLRSLSSDSVVSVFSELYVVVHPSVCRLSVTFVHPTQPIEIFSTPFNTLVT